MILFSRLAPASLALVALGAPAGAPRWRNHATVSFFSRGVGAVI